MHHQVVSEEQFEYSSRRFRQSHHRYRLEIVRALHSDPYMTSAESF
jgi:hypothetical protein